LDKDEYIRIVGEQLKIHCTTHNPNFNYNVTWTYPSTMVSSARPHKVLSFTMVKESFIIIIIIIKHLIYIALFLVLSRFTHNKIM